MSWGQALASLGSGLVRGMATEDDRQRVEAERARLRAVEQMTRERQTRLDAQAQEQQTFQNRQKQAETTRLMAGAGFTPYDEGTVNGAEAQQAGAFDAMAPAPMAGAAGAATRLLGQVKAKRVADQQGGYVKTAMSDQERIRQDEREARVEGQRASLAQAAQLARERMAADADRARESNQTRRDLAGIAAAARQGPAVRLKAVPAGTIGDYQGIAANIREIDDALATFDANPQAADEALGLQNMMPEWMSTMGMSKEALTLRGKLSNLSSGIFLDRSGAAVTPSEAKRLEGWTANLTDNPKKARVALENIRTFFQQKAADMETAYGEEAGYRSLSGAVAPAGRVPSDTPRPATVPARRPGETIAQWRARTGGP